jgi:quercetin dioxygenase-like cupin family protein
MKKSKDSKSNVIELEKSVTHIIVEIIEYLPNAVVSKTILKKSTGNVTAMSFDVGEELGEKISPFDIFIQIIDGTAELIMNNKKHELFIGSGIIIPAHVTHCFNANQQFKMISTVIKSGYEEFPFNTD